MPHGPARIRLDAALAEADEGVVQTNGESEWLSATIRLEEVSAALRAAADSGLGIGGRTGPAMFKAMRRSADNLDERIALFKEGRAALGSASDTIAAMRQQRDQIDLDPETAALPDPGSFSDDPEWDDEKRMTEQGKHSAAVSAFQEREALREQRAREIAEQFDRRYDEPIAVMKKIHGLPDPDPADGPGGAGGQGPGGRTPLPGGRGGSAGQPLLTTGGGLDDPGSGGNETHVDTHEPQQPDTENPHPELDPPTTDGPVTTGPTTTVSPVGTGGGLPGTIGTGVGLGLGGGALLGGISKGVGLVRGLGGGMLAGGQQTRPLGGLSRSAVSGTLGRGPAAGAPVSGRPAARGGVGAAASAGRAGGTTGTTGAAGAGGRGGARTGAAGAAGAGGRGGARSGAAGGRGGAAGAGGAGRGRSKDRRTDSEVYDDDGSDWLDDEAAPGVLG